MSRTMKEDGVHYIGVSLDELPIRRPGADAQDPGTGAQLIQPTPLGSHIMPQLREAASPDRKITEPVLYMKDPRLQYVDRIAATTLLGSLRLLPSWSLISPSFPFKSS
jgi:hypothetical protein